jgi:hypothetical protein
MSFELNRYIFANVLYGAADEHFARDFYPHKPGRIDAPILGIEFIDIQAYRAIGKTQGVKSGGVSHGYPSEYLVEVTQASQDCQRLQRRIARRWGAWGTK